MRSNPQASDYSEADLDVEHPKDHAAGATAVAVSMKRALSQMGVKRTAQTLLKLNQAEGFDCMSCAWPDPEVGHRHVAEFCENGAKAVAEEATRERATPEFFAAHSIAELDSQSEHWLGQQGRITHPMVKRPGATHYEPIDWDEAFALIGQELRGLASPDEAIFYTSGRASNESAFAYQLFARAFGTNNMPDCSNMCHESTSIALQESIGIGKASVSIEDVYHAKLIILAGQNPGTNHPRMLSALEIAKQNGAKIVSINPLREAGLVRFKNPQELKGIVGKGTVLSDLHLPIKLNGDLALFQALGSLLVEWDALDHDFIDRYTTGFEQWRTHVSAVDWDVVSRDHRVEPCADHRARGDAAGLRRHRVLLGDGSDPAPQRGGHHQGGHQPGAGAGQHRQARRRPVPGPWPLQCAGRPHHGHLGTPARALPGRPAEGVRLRPAAGERAGHRRFRPRPAGRQGALLPRPRR